MPQDNLISKLNYEGENELKIKAWKCDYEI